MNILLTCAGRRNYLVQYFRDALDGHGKIYAADTNPNASVLQEADESFIVPSVNQPDYFDVLKNICRQHRIRLLISLSDLELPLLARKREDFLEIGTIPVVSVPHVVDICFDKYRTLDLLKNNGLATPRTYMNLEDVKEALSQGEVTFPLVVKPRWGTASIAIDYPQNVEELGLAYSLAKRRIKRTILAEASMADYERSILVQEFLDGEEFGLDIVNDLDGNYATTFVKRKLAMRAGETDRAITVDSEQLQELGQLIGGKLCHIGNLDCDVFVREGICYVLELNPRFGGGYPFSQVAGANIPAALIAWADGKEPDPSWLKVMPNVMASKCDRLVIRRNELNETIR